MALSAEMDSLWNAVALDWLAQDSARTIIPPFYSLSPHLQNLDVSFKVRQADDFTIVLRKVGICV